MRVWLEWQPHLDTGHSCEATKAPLHTLSTTLRFRDSYVLSPVYVHSWSIERHPVPRPITSVDRPNHARTGITHSMTTQMCKDQAGGVTEGAHNKAILEVVKQAAMVKRLAPCRVWTPASQPSCIVGRSTAHHHPLVLCLLVSSDPVMSPWVFFHITVSSPAYLILHERLPVMS